MKIIAAIAAVALAAQAVELETQAAAETAAQATTESSYNGPIVPESYDYAVHEFNLAQPFTDQECFQKQVDIYADQIIAIEALRLEILQLTQRITQVEHDYGVNAVKIAENKAKISQNSHFALMNAAKVNVLGLDTVDIAKCLQRQWNDQINLRKVLELYCHQYAYVAHLPHQCENILGAGTMLYHAYSWPQL